VIFENAKIKKIVQYYFHKIIFESLLLDSSFLKKVYLCRCKVVKDFCCKVLRGKQVRILYSTRCCEFHKEER